MFEGYADRRPPMLLDREPLPVRVQGAAALVVEPPLPSEEGLDLFRPVVVPETAGGRRVEAFFGWKPGGES